MHHAFLIIAHNEFEILQRLIHQLDSEECDIYVHIDKKVKELPQLSVSKSRLYILSNRIDVRWGNVSQIKCEYTLWEAAYKNGPYDFYHLISGTHFPLVPLKEILSRYSSMEGHNIIPEFRLFDGYQCKLKVRQLNFFTRTFAYGGSFTKRLSQVMWRHCHQLQDLLHIRINQSKTFYIGSNWVSLTQDAIAYMLEHKNSVMKTYRFSFCGDEIFVPSKLMDSHFADSIIWEDYYLYTDFGKGSNPKVLTINDYQSIVDSHCLWARKFSSKDMEIVDKIIATANER